MNTRRRTLLLLLIPLFGLLILAPGVGVVELTLWLLLAAGWLAAFMTWAKPARVG